MNKPKKYKLIITKIINQLKNIIDEINLQIKKQQSLFIHTITIKLDSEKNILKFFFKLKFCAIFRNQVGYNICSRYFKTIK